MNKSFLFLVVALSLNCSHIASRSPSGQAVEQKKQAQGADQYPILSALQKKGHALSDDTLDWMGKWRDMDLEQTDVYSFPKLTGSTSVNLKIQKNGSKSLGIFLAPNDSGNPTAELAYFNMSAILGWDGIMRPAARYQLGPKASQEFLTLINQLLASITAGTTPPDQKSNAEKITQLINSGNPLQGCLKADKDKTADAVDSMCDPKLGDNGGPNFTTPVMASLQVTNPAPVSGNLEVMTGFTGDALQLAIEYSVVMTLDAVFQQDDRYSGGNLGIRKDANGQAHFYSSDNGGAYLNDDDSIVTQNLSWFSRYDRKTIDGLRAINQFLLHPEKAFLGYTDAVKFVTDLGFYFEMDPAESTKILQHNIQMVLDKADATEAKFGKTAYLN